MEIIFRIVCEIKEPQRRRESMRILIPDERQRGQVTIIKRFVLVGRRCRHIHPPVSSLLLFLFGWWLDRTKQAMDGRNETNVTCSYSIFLIYRFSNFALISRVSVRPSEIPHLTERPTATNGNGMEQSERRTWNTISWLVSNWKLFYGAGLIPRTVYNTIMGGTEENRGHRGMCPKVVIIAFKLMLYGPEIIVNRWGEQQ